MTTREFQQKELYIEEGLTFCETPLDYATFNIEYVSYYTNIGDFAHMTVYAQKVQEYLDNCSDQERQSQYFIGCFVDLMFYYIQYHNTIRNFAKAIEYCTIAKEFAESRQKQMNPNRYKLVMEQALYAGAVGLAATGNRAQAIEDLHKALKLAEKSAQTGRYYRVHFNLADVYFEEGDMEKAIHHVTIAQQGLPRQAYDDVAHSVSRLLGDIERHNHNNAAAEEYYQQAYQSIQEAPIIDYYILSGLLQNWVLLYEQTGDFEKALEKHKEYHEAILQFNNNTLQSTIVELDTRHAAELFRQENVYLEKEKKQLQKEKEQSIRKVKRFSKNYRTLQNELKNLRLDFHESMQQTDHADTTKETFQERIDTIQNLLHQQCDEELKFEIHKDFYKNLQAIALKPLNAMEKNVAALIYSKFSTKQMPNFLHRTEGYLLHVRRTLKQKLPIPKGQSLKIFIQRL
jgi:tetratricopeptide (TPR) repeat protein